MALIEMLQFQLDLRQRVGIEQLAQLRLAEELQNLDQRRNIEDIAQNLAVGLQDDRKRSELRSDLQQIVGPLPLLPQRRAALRPVTRKQKSARSGLAKFRREKRARAELPDHQLLDFFDIRHHQLGARWQIGFRKTDDEAVVAPHGFD